MKRYVGLLALAVFFLLAQTAGAANLVTNGGFEDPGGAGSLDGWTQLGASGIFGVIDSTYPHSGDWAALLGSDPAITGLAYLSQPLTTTIGASYTLRFWLQNGVLGGDITPNEFLVNWNGGNIYDQSDLPAFSYTEYVFPGLVATAVTTVLEFGFRQEPDYFLLDDVSVIPVPIPGAVWLLGSGLVGLAGLRRKYKS